MYQEGGGTRSSVNEGTCGGGGDYKVFIVEHNA